MFYTITISPLLVTKYVFYANNYFQYINISVYLSLEILIVLLSLLHDTLFVKGFGYFL